MNVLAVGAHPDDIEFLCSGTLTLYAQKGYKVFMCHSTNGNLGHLLIPRDELREIRRQEAIDAAKVIGAVSLTTDINDMEIFDNAETRLKIAEIIRKADPDLIITHSSNDYHPDHFITGQVTFHASFASSLPQLVTETKPNRNVTPLFYMDTMAGINFHPEEYVDITDVIEIKKEMLSCHKSQMTWLKEHHNIDMIEFMFSIARFRGIQCNAKYAEGFRKLDVWGRQTVTRILP